MAESIRERGRDRESSGPWRWAKWILSVGAIVALVVVVVNVTRDDAGDPLPPSHEPPEGGGLGAGYSEEQAFEFAACMRGERIDFPDPEIGDDGQVAMSPGPGVDTNGSAFQEAAAACEAELAATGGQTTDSSGSQAPGGSGSQAPGGGFHWSRWPSSALACASRASASLILWSAPMVSPR